MNWAYAKKALVAAGVATGGALLVALGDGVPSDVDGWLATVAAAVGVGVAAGLATYKARNKGLPAGGSEPR